MPSWASRLGAALKNSLRGLPANFEALSVFYRASPGLTLWSLVLATCSGLLAPAFMLVTGTLVQAVRDGSSVVAPLALTAAIFAVQRTIDPIREELGDTIWPRVDEWLGDRIMVAASAPAGLQELEDPAVLDRIAQARGAMTGFTPGQAAQQFAGLWAQRVQTIASLAIVTRWYWWAGVALVLVYVVSYNVSRWHWDQITVVLLGRTDQMRRSYYLRGLALSSQMAKETRIFHLADWLVDRYLDSSLGVFRQVWQKRNEGWLAAAAIVLLVSGIEALTLGTLASDAAQARISLGTAVGVAQAVLAAGLLFRYDDMDWEADQAAESARKVAELEGSTAGVTTLVSGERAADGMPRKSIRFEDVGFTYPGRLEPVLHAFNLALEAGRSLAIVGENGAGKTTLVKLLARLYDPTAGRITVDGVDLRDVQPAAWHRRVTAIFQDFARFEMAAYDNVAFGALHAWDDAAAVERAAADAGVLEVIERLGQGWQTTLSREYHQGAELSGGEWQRLALARALFGVAGGAGLLILDEPTASLDVRGEAAVYQRFLELTRGVTTIVISHRFSTVRRADRIVVVEGGKVIEDGTHDALVSKRDGRYAKMYELQASRFAEAC
ncbi:MAG: ATP-binding cassette domain-containing protein [Chloroflexota bacterium]|nr:ATP-binding cassette domain-containing protein [Chloroflexota bacterium]